MPLDDIGWNLEVLWILGMFYDTVGQLVVVGKLLGVELSLQAAGHACYRHFILAGHDSNRTQPARRLIHLAWSIRRDGGDGRVSGHDHREAL